MRIRTLPTIPTKSLDTVIHTFLCCLDALIRRYDIVYMCGVGNAVFCGILKLGRIPTVLNVDGADFKRDKWGPFASKWLKKGENFAPKLATKLIADNFEIQKRYQAEQGVTPAYLTYGAWVHDEPASTDVLKELQLEREAYILFVSRLVPENGAHLVIEAYKHYSGNLKLVIVGPVGYESEYVNRLKSDADERVVFAGGRFHEEYIALSQNALFFVMPAEIEATRVVLVDQLGLGSAILYRDCPASREVIGEAGIPFAGTPAPKVLAEKISELETKVSLCRDCRKRARGRAAEKYDWETITRQHEDLFYETLGIRLDSK